MKNCPICGWEFSTLSVLTLQYLLMFRYVNVGLQRTLHRTLLLTGILTAVGVLPLMIAVRTLLRMGMKAIAAAIHQILVIHPIAVRPINAQTAI